jgi:3-oxoacyl-(acyl-carrier-protein) synthase
MIIAITGVGLISPAGLTLPESVARLAQGPLQPVAPTDAAMQTPQLLTVPAAFEPKRIVKRRKDLKLMARANQLALAAAREALAHAGRTDDDATDAGLFLGVGREPGKLDDLLPVVHHAVVNGQMDLDRLIDEGLDWMHPLSSLKTLPNMSVAHVSIALGTMGPTQALCSGPDAGARSLLEAATAIAEGLTPWALAGGADARTELSDRLCAHRVGATAPLGEAAAVFVLEPLSVAEARGATVHGIISARGEEPEIGLAALGDCGAATATAALALALGRGTSAAWGPVALLSPEPKRAPAVHVARPMTIAITAVGAITPLGETIDDIGRRLLAGESAAAPIRAFSSGRFPVRNACEVADADLAARLPASLAVAVGGREDRRAELALLAGLRAAEAYGDLPPGTGVTFATGLSSVTLGQLDQDIAPHVSATGAFDFGAFGRAPVDPGSQAPWRNLVARPLHLLAEHLGLRGPRACHFSACAAGTAAIAHAADLIRRGEAEVMLAGGADSMIHPFGLLPFIRLGATSTEVDPARTGLPFDQDRNGFIMGEGAAFFVLEPLERARAAGRTVHGLLLGAGTSVDAWRVTAPHPDGLGAERAMRAALKAAGLSGADVDYVNAHGTGTPLNDVAEAGAIARVCGADTAVSSSKGQLGHAIAAAGAVELACTLAAFAHDGVLPNAHLYTPDPAIEVDLVGRVGRRGAPGVVLSNSFGFGGQNASLVIGHPDRGGHR